MAIWQLVRGMSVDAGACILAIRVSALLPSRAVLGPVFRIQVLQGTHEG